MKSFSRILVVCAASSPNYRFPYTFFDYDSIFHLLTYFYFKMKIHVTTVSGKPALFAINDGNWTMKIQVLLLYFSLDTVGLRPGSF